MLQVKVDSAAVEAALENLADGLDDLPMGSAAQRAARAVAGFAPRRSGALASSVSGRDAGKGIAQVNVDIVYGGVINFGWPKRNIAPAGFVERGLGASKQGMAGDVADALETLIAKEGLS